LYEKYAKIEEKKNESHSFGEATANAASTMRTSTYSKTDETPEPFANDGIIPELSSSARARASTCYSLNKLTSYKSCNGIGLRKTFLNNQVGEYNFQKCDGNGLPKKTANSFVTMLET